MATRKEEAMWLLERLVSESTANNLSLAFRFEGALNGPALEQAVGVLVRHHEVLRTVYFATGAELMKGVVPADDFAVDIEEFDSFAPPLAEIDLALRPFVNQRFVFDGRPLLRIGLFHHSEGDVVCLAFHHLVYDIISGKTLLEDLVELYQDLRAGSEPAARFRTVVPAHHERDPTPESLAWWRENLQDFDPSGLDLWCGSPDTSDPTLQGDQIVVELSEQARASVQRLPREVRAPEAVVLMAAFDVLLAAHGAGPDLTVGTPVSVRPKDAPGAVGHHTNVLPIRVRIDPAGSFRTLVRQTRDGYFGALAHADVPVDSVSDLVPRAGSSWRNRLCRHLFNYFPGLGMTEFPIDGRRGWPIVVENGFSKFDLEFFIASTPERITVTARYGSEKLHRDDAQLLLERFDDLLVLLGTDVERPIGDLPVWSARDRAVIGAANDTAVEFTPPDVISAVRAHALDHPDSVAVQHGGRSVSYRRLWDAAVTVRDTLLKEGVSVGDFVGIAASRSPELVASVLGVWLARAAYLPIDPEHPAQRVSYLLSDSGAQLVLTDRDLDLGAEAPRTLRFAPVDEAPAADPAEKFAVDPEACAYLIYTSGSTGRPKGALIPHRAITNIAADYAIRLRMGRDDATLWMTTFAFDMANLEHYVPLYSGSRIVIAPDEARIDGAVLLDHLVRYRPGIIQATPTTLRVVLDDIEGELSGLRVVTGAEQVPVPLAVRLMAGGAEVINAYGPTETVTWCTWGPVRPDPGERLDIGVPISNIRVLVVAPDGRELPIGVQGELWIAGAGVALGYHNRPDLNAERFGVHPVHGAYYRSGDLGRWRADGTLELFGRADRQIKLRGNRIELGEVEAALVKHPKVRAAAVIVAGDRSADGRLIAFLEMDGEGEIGDELWEYAGMELPRSALPQAFFVVEALPTNANEKVDYLALDLMASTRRASHSDSPDREAAGSGDGAADELVQTLVALWRQLLDRDDVTADDNFFTNGGHSLLGARLTQEAERITGVGVKLSDLFAAPTPLALAQVIRAAQNTPPEQDPGTPVADPADEDQFDRGRE